MCTRPKLLDVGKLSGGLNSFYKYVPCGMCLECRNMRREEYTQRLKHEISEQGYIASFISLTYRDDELPLLLPAGSAVVGTYFGSVPPAYGSTLSRKDLSQFCDKLCKRARRKYGRSIKYVAVGEYGDDGHRPHYHLIVVGLPANNRKMVYECWNKGNVDIQPAGNGSIRYCLEYIDKQVFCADQIYEAYGDFQPPFAHFSKGLGASWIKRNLENFDEYGTIFYNEKKSYTLNPYYRRKYGFKTKPYINTFSESVYRYQAEHPELTLPEAHYERCKTVELSLQRKQVRSREPLVVCSKHILRKELARVLTKQNVTLEDFQNFTKNMLNFADDYLLTPPSRTPRCSDSPARRKLAYYTPQQYKYLKTVYNIRS